MARDNADDARTTVAATDGDLRPLYVHRGDMGARTDAVMGVMDSFADPHNSSLRPTEALKPEPAASPISGHGLHSVRKKLMMTTNLGTTFCRT